MSYFADADELAESLELVLADFIASPDGATGVKAAMAYCDELRLTIRTSDPEATVSVDFIAATTAREPIPNPTVRLEIQADALHDILMNRLGPVEISSLLERNRVVVEGPPAALGALIVIAGPLQRQYEDSLARHGRRHLLGTPQPAVGEIWHGPDTPGDLIGSRRPWQSARGGSKNGSRPQGAGAETSPTEAAQG